MHRIALFEKLLESDSDILGHGKDPSIAVPCRKLLPHHVEDSVHGRGSFFKSILFNAIFSIDSHLVSENPIFWKYRPEKP
jgi:hypothetical protein